MQLLYVGGLNGNPVGSKPPSTDLNQIKENGIYGINSNMHILNVPFENGVIIVFNSGDSALGGNPVIQVGFAHANNRLYIRLAWIDVWGEWFVFDGHN